MTSKRRIHILQYYNYKQFHSVVLLDLVDADYKYMTALMLVLLWLALMVLFSLTLS